MTEISNGFEYEKELTRIFNRFNKHYYNNELPEVVITFVPTARKHGHITTQQVWLSDTLSIEGKYELNISAYTINRPPEEICATLLHEQAHLYNIIHNIIDCSNMNRYHNKKFKKTAEDHGLICTYRDKLHGWTNTTLDEEARKYIQKLNIKQFVLHRLPPKPSTYHKKKYSCPCGKSNVTSKYKQNLICGYCGNKLEEC